MAKKVAARAAGIVGGVGAAAGAGIGAAVGNFIEPLKTRLITDTSWHMNNSDGSQSFPVTSETLNQPLHDAAVHAGTLTGAALLGAAGITAGLYLAHKNRNLGRQFD